MFKLLQRLKMNIFVVQFYKNSFGMCNSLDVYPTPTCTYVPDEPFTQRLVIQHPFYPT